VTKIFCDRCGKETDRSRRKDVTVGVDGDEEHIRKDLCDNCWLALKEFFRPLPVAG